MLVARRLLDLCAIIDTFPKKVRVDIGSFFVLERRTRKRATNLNLTLSKNYAIDPDSMIIES